MGRMFDVHGATLFVWVRDDNSGKAVGTKEREQNFMRL